MSDEQLFLEATKEASSPARDEALWAKAMALAEGVEDKAKYLYIKMRVKQLAESRKEQQNHISAKSVDSQQTSKGPLLLQVNKSFALYENAFIYQGKEYLYDGVSSVYYHGSINEINLVNVGSQASMSLKHDDCGYISVDAETWIFKTRSFKNIGRAANIVAQKTFRGRLARYIKKLNTDGYISIPKVDFKKGGKEIEEWEVRIYANGDVVEKDQRFNLRRALVQKGLQIGYDAHFGYEGVSNPYEVIVSETGTAFWNKKIKFDITTDFDVMSGLLRSLAGIQGNRE
jgi:hypothetical protein